MQGAGNVIVLLQSRAASEDLGQPELADSTLHVADFALRWRGRLDPLRRLAANATDHVGMGQSLGGALLGLVVGKGRGNWLCDPRVEGRGATGNDQVAVDVFAAGDGPVAGLRATTREGGRRCK